MLLILLLGAAIGLCLCGGALALLMFVNQRIARWLGDATLRVRDAVIRACGGVPWLNKDVTILTGGTNAHLYFFVSRHHLAEGGLTCPQCEERIRAGDFSQVCRAIVDGRENEVIVCRGRRTVNDREVRCETLLIACPDTEHGDHLGADGKPDAHGDDPPEYYRFVRAPNDQWLREKWGVESEAVQVGQTVQGDEIVDVAVPAGQQAVADSTKHLTEAQTAANIHAIMSGRAEPPQEP